MTTYFKKNYLALLLTITAIFFILQIPVMAATVTGLKALDNTLQTTANSGHIDIESNLPAKIGSIVSYFFGIIGVISLVFTITGGFLWMIAGGNEEKVGKAKKFVGEGINGLIVVFLAYSLVYVVLAALKYGTSG
ncbi:MAG: hypothetical protein PHW95_01950 [Patescibacteria group bacterium]|nr:hypothetical protein [Patescibacteria group bacterium]